MITWLCNPTNIDLESKSDCFFIAQIVSKIIKIKTHKLIPYAVVRKEEEKKRNKSDIRLIYSLQCCPIILETNLSLNTTSSHFLV